MPFERLLPLTQHLKQAYDEYIHRENILALRVTYLVSLVYTLVYLFFDYWRADEYRYILLYRSLQSAIFLLSIIFTYRIEISPRALHWLGAVSSTFIAVLLILIDFSAGLPVYFLPNSLFLVLFSCNIMLAYPIRVKFYQNIFMILIFVVYSIFLSPNSGYHPSQIPIFFTIASFTFIGGFLIERYKQSNFLNHYELKQAKKKIENLDQVKTRLLSVFSHDISSPLKTLKGLLQLQHHKMLSEEENIQHSAKVEKSLDNTLVMLKDLVTWSRSQMDGFQLNKERVEIRQVLDEVINSVEHIAQQKDIQIISDVPESVLLNIDKEIFKLIVRNFLTNALKFSFAGSSIHITSWEKNGMFTLSVKDVGAGMSQELVKRLFSFNKFSEPGSQGETGAGIGLMISREFANLMGATISVESESGKGSIFSITFSSF